MPPCPQPPTWSLIPSLLDFGIIFGRFLGKILFHKAPKMGTKAGRLRTQRPPKPRAESQSWAHPPSRSPELLGISLLHLDTFFHKLHVFVQQIQPPLRVAFQHLKLILIAGA